jgi:dipeptidyl aminopeptidase/acylaminoacyl peptidase
MNQNTPRKAALFLLLCACGQLLFAQPDSVKLAAAALAKKPRPMNWRDVPSWKYIGTSAVTLSPDGKWLAWPLLTTEGDGELIIKAAGERKAAGDGKVGGDGKATGEGKATGDTVKRRYPIGGVGQTSFAFSDDGQWIAFKEAPAFKEARAAKASGKQLFDKLFLVNLATGKSTTFEKAGEYAFNGKAATCLAVSLVREKAAGAKPDDPKSNDLLLIELKTGKIQDIGSVGEFAWDKPGTWLAYTTETAGKTGNGLYLLSTATRQTTVLDNDKMTYKSLRWKEEGDAFAVLKMKKDTGWKTEKGVVIGVKDLGGSPNVVVYDPARDSASFPKGMTISGNRVPRWSDDLSRLFFGIAALTPEKKPVAHRSAADSAARKDGDTLKPDMIIWNGRDRRLQSRQQVEESQDKEFSWYGMLDVAGNHFSRLNDSTQRSLTLLPKTHYALIEDRSAYELDNNLDGQTYEDLYIVDLATGRQRKWMEKFYLPSYASEPLPSPDGKKLVYGLDGHYYVYDIPSDRSVNITDKIPTSFVNTEDDHNVTKPLTPFVGWSSDSKWLLVHDLWDIWEVSANGGGVPAVNLTRNGRPEHIRYQYRFVLDPEEKGIDIAQPLYVSMYGEWTKKSGIGRIGAGKAEWQAGVESLVWEDAGVGSLSKAKHAAVYAFSREDFSKPTEFFVGGPLLKDAVQATHNAPLADRYTWSAGVRLVNYVSEKGDSLQGALFLPAGYEQGKKYPTMVYYYEKLSQSLHGYVRPDYSRTGWNPTMYTSNGYAVFIPDIVYKINDPGMSAVWCVIPGVKAAMKTGVIDEQRIGIHGHSWGGYQTAFLVTQTDMFRAAAAGAPLTDMISMYDMIYWNAGVGDMAIFEASQGRLTSGPWDNWDAYRRNSPVYHVKDVKTPLLILHNDKDGAVDFEQGIEYYNALRRLKKPVTMITYRGENHGLAKRENMRDYSVRMMEYFDYYLKGMPAPEWWIKGIDRVDMEEELERRLPGADDK